MSSHYLKARGRLRARNKNWSPKWTKWPQMQCFFPIRLMQCFFPFRNAKNEALLKFSMDQKRSMNTFYLFFVDVKMHQWYQWPTLKVESAEQTQIILHYHLSYFYLSFACSYHFGIWQKRPYHDDNKHISIGCMGIDRCLFQNQYKTHERGESDQILVHT